MSNSEAALRSLTELLLESREKHLTFLVRPAIDADNPLVILLNFSASKKSATWEVDRNLFKSIEDGWQKSSQNTYGVEIEFVRQVDAIEVTMSMLNQETGSFETIDFKLSFWGIKALLMRADAMTSDSIDRLLDDDKP